MVKNYNAKCDTTRVGFTSSTKVDHYVKRFTTTPLLPLAMRHFLYTQVVQSPAAVSLFKEEVPATISCHLKVSIRGGKHWGGAKRLTALSACCWQRCL